LKTPLEILADQPHRFQFDAAVRLLEAAANGADHNGAIDFAAPPKLGQPVAEVVTAEPAKPDKRARLVTGLIGLIGPSGEMPRWYTELLAQAQRQKSFAVLDFFNLLAQRLIAAFAAAGAKYRLPRSAERAGKTQAEEPIGGALLAFTGYGTPNLENRLAFNPDALRHYAGFFAAHPRSASRLASMVSDYLGRNAEILEFAGAWAQIAPDQQSRLPAGRRAGAFCRLGVDAAIGVRAWDQQARFIVKIGPLNLTEFRALLPDQPQLRALVSLIRAYVGWEADFAVQLILQTAEIPALKLKNGLAEDAPRLGWSSWLPTETGVIRGRQEVGDAMFSAAMVEGLQP
jgi:type VI secretion system protein ImpH